MLFVNVPFVRRVCVLGIALAALALSAAPAAAQARYAVLVQGASGGDEWASLHRRWIDALATLLRNDFHYDATHLLVLAEQPKAGELRATAESVRSSLSTLAKTIGANDQLIIVLIGHGSAQGGDAKFNLVGPDLSVADWKALVDAVRGRVALVATSSASFPFLAGLSAPGRVVITATNTAAQRYHTMFPESFVAAFGDPQADLDKNGRVSLLEAFTYASRGVTAYYEQKGTMATENALIDDNGDGVGRLATATGDDGSVAALTYFGGVVVATSTDPEMQRLLARQQALTEQVDDLRRRQGSMPKDQFQEQFERLMLDLATVSAEVRKRTPAP